MGNHFDNSTHAELWGAALGCAARHRAQAETHDRIAKRMALPGDHSRVRPAPGHDRATADLLEALAHHVHHGVGTAGESEKLLKEPGATLLTVFGPKLAEQQRNLRHLVVLEAADITLRKDAQAWLHAGEAGQTRHARALESNSGLAAVLAELETLRGR